MIINGRSQRRAGEWHVARTPIRPVRRLPRSAPVSTPPGPRNFGLGKSGLLCAFRRPFRCRFEGHATSTGREAGNPGCVARGPVRARDRQASMSWPGRQQRVLDQIEKRLLGDDLRLGSLFAVFTRLASEDAMPRQNGLKQGRGDRGRQRVREAVTRRGAGAWHGISPLSRVIAARGAVRAPGYRPDYRLISHPGQRRVL